MNPAPRLGLAVQRSGPTPRFQYNLHCDADLTGESDAIINFGDLTVLKQAFFTDEGADVDLSGPDVSAVDLGALKALFFGPPGPSGTGHSVSVGESAPQTLVAKAVVETSLPDSDASNDSATVSTPVK